MVYQPGKQKKTLSQDFNQWMVMVEAGKQDELEAEIKTLIKEEGMTGKFKVVDKLELTEDLYVLAVKCNEAFGKKLEKLPSAKLAYPAPVRRPANRR